MVLLGPLFFIPFMRPAMGAPPSLFLRQRATSNTTTSSVPSTLNITTLTAANNISILECWALEPGFVQSNQAGTAGSAAIGIGALGSTTANATYSIIPAQFNGGRHNAPVAQWVIFLSGLAHITLPHSSDEVYVTGGKHGALLALDTAGVSTDGHFTVYPTDEVTTVLQIPLQGGVPPSHVKLHAGSCTAEEQDF